MELLFKLRNDTLFLFCLIQNKSYIRNFPLYTKSISVKKSDRVKRTKEYVCVVRLFFRIRNGKWTVFLLPGKLLSQAEESKKERKLQARCSSMLRSNTVVGSSPFLCFFPVAKRVQSSGKEALRIILRAI